MSGVTRTRDAWVDESWSGFVDVDGTLLGATFPSAYVNANRDRDDLDASLLDEVHAELGRVWTSTVIFKGSDPLN